MRVTKWFDCVIKNRMVRIGVMTVSFVLLGISLSGMFSCAEERAMQREIAHQVLRFHVRANSDSQEDQSLKCIVRDRVVSMMQEYLCHAENKEEAVKILSDHLPELVSESEKIVRDQGYSYPVTASIHKERFPDRTYGDMCFPEGIYDALVIEIGSGTGHNWWCVMYPSLCFLDEDTAKVPEESKEYLKEHLTKDSYQSLIVEGEEEKVEFRFAIFDWFMG